MSELERFSTVLYGFLRFRTFVFFSIRVFWCTVTRSCPEDNFLANLSVPGGFVNLLSCYSCTSSTSNKLIVLVFANQWGVIVFAANAEMG